MNGRRIEHHQHRTQAAFSSQRVSQSLNFVELLFLDPYVISSCPFVVRALLLRKHLRRQAPGPFVPLTLLVNHVESTFSGRQA